MIQEFTVFENLPGARRMEQVWGEDPAEYMRIQERTIERICDVARLSGLKPVRRGAVVRVTWVVPNVAEMKVADKAAFAGECLHAALIRLGALDVDSPGAVRYEFRYRVDRNMRMVVSVDGCIRYDRRSVLCDTWAV